MRKCKKVSELRIGQRVYFRPHAEYIAPDSVMSGRIIAVNREHRHFTVCVDINGVQIKESFKC